MAAKKKCWYCSCTLGKVNTTQDHVVPKCKGGTDKASNLVDACLECNHDKNGLSLEEWRVLYVFRKGLLPKVEFKFYGET